MGLCDWLLGRQDQCQLPGIEEFDVSRVPFHVIPDPILSNRVIAALKTAVAFWNESLGREMFVPVGELREGGSIVPLSMFNGTEPYRVRAKLAWTRLTLTRNHLGIRDAAIRMNTKLAEGHPQLLDQAIAHECGHVLGLAHDKVLDSVMWPKVRKGWSLTGDSGEKLRVTDKDRAFLLEVYG